MSQYEQHFDQTYDYALHNFKNEYLKEQKNNPYRRRNSLSDLEEKEKNNLIDVDHLKGPKDEKFINQNNLDPVAQEGEENSNMVQDVNLDDIKSFNFELLEMEEYNKYNKSIADKLEKEEGTDASKQFLYSCEVNPFIKVDDDI